MAEYKLKPTTKYLIMIWGILQWFKNILDISKDLIYDRNSLKILWNDLMMNFNLDKSYVVNENLL